MSNVVMFFMLGANELQDVTAYGLRSDILSPETMPKATVEIALTKNRKLLLACMLAFCCVSCVITGNEDTKSSI